MGATPQHLSLDDLFAPLPDYSMLGGSGPFVINLSSSTVPVSLPNNGISVAPNTRVYQIRCVEDRSVRYRLRLGPFVTETQANAVLAVVRDNYPAALTATAIASDLEAFADLQFEAVSAEVAAAAPQAKAVPAGATVAKPEPLTAEISFSPAPAPAPVAPVPVVTPAAVAPPELTLTTMEYTPPVSARVLPAAAAAAAAAAADVSPLPEIFTLELLAEPMPAATAPRPAVTPTPPPTPKKSLIESLTALGFPPTNTSKQVPVRLARRASKSIPILQNVPKAAPATTPKPMVAAASKPAVAVPAKPAALPPAKPTVAAAAPPSRPVPAAKPVVAATKLAAPVSPPDKAPARPAATSWPTAEELDKRPLSLESTQTLRTLTPSELETATRRWFVVELATSDRAFDPDAVPNLDIFSVYRLYSVESSNQGAIKHTLRLGFFSEAIAAQAVADYLSSHYEKPAVARVSIAERERFSEQGIEARKNVEATGRHAVIEITDERYVRAPRALG